MLVGLFKGFWRSEGLAYVKFVKGVGFGGLFVLPSTRTQLVLLSCQAWCIILTLLPSQSQIFRFRVRHFQTPRKHQHNCIACEETGRSISQYLSTKQTKSGLYSETARQSHLRGINGDGGAFQPAGGGLSVVSLDDEVRNSSVSPTTNDSNQVRSVHGLSCSGKT